MSPRHTHHGVVGSSAWQPGTVELARAWTCAVTEQGGRERWTEWLDNHGDHWSDRVPQPDR